MTDPHLVVCCGKHFCASCLTEWFKKRGSRESCPHCRADGKNFTHVINKSLKSEIDELKINCSNHDKGCEWAGQLRDFDAHLTSERGCDYEEVPCPNKCQEKLIKITITKYLYRKDLASHLANNCINRLHLCRFCHKVDTYEKITGSHYNVCVPNTLFHAQIYNAVIVISREKI